MFRPVAAGLAGLLLALAAAGCGTQGQSAEAPPAAEARAQSDMSQGGVERLLEDEPPEPAPQGTTLAELRAAVARDPDDAETHRRLGLVLRREGDAEQSLAHLERAVELAPDEPGPLMSLGMEYSARGRLDEAAAMYERLLATSPDNARAMNNLGNIALRQGDEERAIRYYRRAVESDPNYLMALHRLADVLRYYGRYDEAYPVYERVLALEPTNRSEERALIDSLYGQGAINLSREEYELAERQLGQVLEQVPYHRSAHYARAQALIQLGRHEEAQGELQTHMRILVASGEGF